MDKLIELPCKGKAVFIGDTHGDYNSTRFVIKNFIHKANIYLVFLGDYVDKGSKSKENIDFLLETQKKHPNLILLAGNHESFPFKKCSPADFWNSLDDKEYEYYKEFFASMPLAVSGNGFIALHGGLPDIENIQDINSIQPCDENWMRILWGDFRDKEGECLGHFLGRPKFGRDYFQKIMQRIGKNVLIRSHDPLAPEVMFNNRCLTLFTSAAYGPKKRKIGIFSMDKPITSITDIQIISMDAQDIPIIPKTHKTKAQHEKKKLRRI